LGDRDAAEDGRLADLRQPDEGGGDRDATDPLVQFQKVGRAFPVEGRSGSRVAGGSLRRHTAPRKRAGTLAPGTFWEYRRVKRVTERGLLLAKTMSPINPWFAHRSPSRTRRGA